MCLGFAGVRSGTVEVSKWERVCEDGHAYSVLKAKIAGVFPKTLVGEKEKTTF